MNILNNNFLQSIILITLGAGLAVLSYTMGKNPILDGAAGMIIGIGARHLGDSNDSKPPQTAIVETPPMVIHTS